MAACQWDELLSRYFTETCVVLSCMCFHGAFGLCDVVVCFIGQDTSFLWRLSRPELQRVNLSRSVNVPSADASCGARTPSVYLQSRQKQPPGLLFVPELRRSTARALSEWSDTPRPYKALRLSKRRATQLGAVGQRRPQRAGLEGSNGVPSWSSFFTKRIERLLPASAAKMCDHVGTVWLPKQWWAGPDGLDLRTHLAFKHGKRIQTFIRRFSGRVQHLH